MDHTSQQSKPPHALTHRRRLRLVAALPVMLLAALTLLLGHVGARGQTEPPPNIPSACPAIPGSVAAANFPDIIEGSNICLYDGANAPDHANGVISHIEAGWMLGAADLAWDRYVTDFGFNPPPTDGTGKRALWVYRGDEADIAAYLNFGPGTGCNGVSRTSLNVMGAWIGCFDPPTEQVFGVSAHETFHGVQIGMTGGGNAAGWFMEGGARAMEDHVFLNLDNWPTAMAAGFSFNNEVNNYLGATNADLTDNANRYKSALWWTFFMEQFGTEVTEPERGMDAFLALWETVDTLDDVAAVNQALSDLGAGMDFHAAFRKFVLVNWTKDLDLGSLPDSSYYYFDEQEAGNPAPYGPIAPFNGGIFSTLVDQEWNNQNIGRYGAQYFRALPSSTNCPVATVSLSKNNGDSAFYHVVAHDGTALYSLTSNDSQDWAQSFINNADLSALVAVVGSLGNSSTVDVSFTCADPALTIVTPNGTAQAYVGSASDPDKFLVNVLVTNGDPGAPVVAGLTIDDFSAAVNGVKANIVAGGFVQEQYWFEIQAPDQNANGTYDLEVFLEEPGSSTVIADDLSADSVIYDATHGDQVLVIDRSGSMADSDKIVAARDAANFYIDVARDDDGLAVVPFRGDVIPAPFDMDLVDAGVRGDAHDYVDLLGPGGATSIGDGLHEAAGQIVGSPTGNPRCSFVLLSDGMENTEQYWDDIKDDVIGTGCPVHTIAFGPASNESLMQEIASATGGLPNYNDVSPSGAAPEGAFDYSDMSLALGNSYEYAQSRSAGRQRFFSQTGILNVPLAEDVHLVYVDESASEMLFTLDWVHPWVDPISMRLRLRQPNGIIIDPSTTPYDFVDYQTSEYLGWRIQSPMPGEWQLLVSYLAPSSATPVPYSVSAGGRSNLTVELLLPAQLHTKNLTGDSVPIYALVAADAPITEGTVMATVTAPDGSATTITLYDDGAHADGEPGDGIFGNWYTLVNQAQEAVPGDEGVPEPPPNDEGAYRVKVVAAADTYRREAHGSFSVLEGPDANDNRLPDNWEAEHGVSDPDGDPDNDDLTTYREYQAGTDPNDSDTDDGGENDGSEVNNNQNPLDPGDDQISAPEYFRVQAADDAVILHFDVDPGYESMALYTAPTAAGPWSPWGDIGLTSPMTCTDPCAHNGEERYFRILAYTGGTESGSPANGSPAYGGPANGGNHQSAALTSEGVTPSEDSVLPDAVVLVNAGAASTLNLTNVSLTFGPPQDDTAPYDDIVEVMLSNSPHFPGASWQPFEQAIPWEMADVAPGDFATVYARFKDAAGNESSGVSTGTIRYAPPLLYLPVALKP